MNYTEGELVARIEGTKNKKLYITDNEDDTTKTELTLTFNYNVKTNIPIYGEFWSKKIIIDFEQKLLKALKKRNEE